MAEHNIGDSYCFCVFLYDKEIYQIHVVFIRNEKCIPDIRERF